MADILKFIMLIIACYFIFAAPIKNLREFKNKSKSKELRLRKEENLPREGMTRGAKISCFMVISSIIITIIIFYVRKLEYKMSMIFAVTLIIFMFELVLGDIWIYIKQVISCYKNYALIKTIFFTVLTILGIALVLYVKYSR